MRITKLVSALLCFLCLGTFVCSTVVKKEKYNEVSVNPVHGISRVKMRGASSGDKVEEVQVNSMPSSRIFEQDRRFMFYLHVPEEYEEYSQEQKKNTPFVVVVHGLRRNAKQLFDIAVERYPHWIILAPLFPERVYSTFACESGEAYFNGNDYRLLISSITNRVIHGKSGPQIINETIRFDHVLIGMVCQGKSSVGIDCREDNKISLVGFSAGAQFSHRFAYLHASMLKHLAIGAPGTVTFWNESLPYWKGTGNMEAIFGKNYEVEHLKDVNVLFYVGSEDTKILDAETGTNIGGNDYSNNRADKAVTRIKLINELYHEWDEIGLGLTRELKIIDGVGHDSAATLKDALNFIEENISKGNGEQSDVDVDEK